MTKNTSNEYKDAHSSQTDDNGVVNQAGVSAVKDILTVQDYKYFSTEWVETSGSTPIFDGIIDLNNLKSGKGLEHRYKIPVQIKSTREAPQEEVEVKIDSLKVKHFWEYSTHLGVLIIKSYPYRLQQGIKRPCFYWSWFTPEEALDVYHNKSTQKSTGITLNRKCETVEDVEELYHFLYKKIDARHLVPIVDKEVRLVIQRSIKNKEKQYDQKRFISDVQIYDPGSDLVRSLNKIILFIHSDPDSEASKSLLESIANNPAKARALMKIFIARDAIYLQPWLRNLHLLVNTFTLEQEKFSEAEDGTIYTDEAMLWLNLKLITCNTLYTHYTQSTPDNKRIIEQLTLRVIGLTDYKPLQAQCFVYLQKYEQVSDNFTAIALEIAQGNGYAKSVVSEFLPNDTWTDRRGKQEVALALLKNFSLQKTWVDTGVLQTWRGDAHDYSMMSKYLYVYLSQTIPEDYPNSEWWVEALMEAFIVRSNLDYNGAWGAYDHETISAPGSVIDGYTRDRLYDGFNVDKLKEKTVIGLTFYSLFKLLYIFLRKLDEIQRNAAVTDILKNKAYRRDGICFALFRIFSHNKWKIPESLEELLNEYSEYIKGYRTQFYVAQGEKVPSQVVNFSLTEYWRIDKLGWQSGETKTFSFQEGLDSLKKKDPDYEFYIDFDLQRWRTKITNILEYESHNYDWYSESELLPYLLANFARANSEVGIEVYDYCHSQSLQYTAEEQLAKRNFLQGCARQAIDGVYNSDASVRTKITLSKRILNDNNAEYVAHTILRFLEKTVENPQASTFTLRRVYQALTPYVQSSRSFLSNFLQDTNKYLTAHDLTSYLINSNQARAWIVLLLHLHKKLPKYRKDIDSMSLSYISKEPLVHSAVLYSYLYRGIEDDDWRDGLLANSLTIAFSDAKATRDGRLPLAVLVIQRDLRVSKSNSYRQLLEQVATRFFREYTTSDQQTVQILQDMYVFFGLISSQYASVLQGNNDSLKHDLLAELTRVDSRHYSSILGYIEMDTPPIPNPGRAKDRLVGAYRDLVQWQNDQFMDKQVLEANGERITPVTFYSFFDPLNEATSAENVTQFFEFWGDGLIQSVLQTPSAWSIPINRGSNYLDNLVSLGDTKVDVKLLLILSTLSGNSEFMSRGAVKACYASIQYLNKKYNSSWSLYTDLKTVNDRFSTIDPNAILNTLE